MFTTSNTNGSTLATSAASVTASSARSSSRGSPYSSHTYGAYSGTNINPMHHQNSAAAAGYQDYSSMYPVGAMDPMAWHAAYASANLYRGYEAAAAAHDGMWPPQAGHPHMNSFIPNNEISEPSGLSSLTG